MIAQAADVTQVSWFSLETAAPNDVLGAWIVCFLTLAVFSFLYRDNPFYKLAEHLFVGLGAAWYTLENYDSGVLGPVREYLHQAAGKLGRTDPSTGLPLVVELGGYPVPPAWAIGLRCVALVFSVMLLVRLFSRNHWAPRWPLAAMVGIYAAIKMTGETQSKLVIQIRETMTPLIDPNAVAWSGAAKLESTWQYSLFANLVFLIGLICVLSHFIFTYRRNRVLGGMSRAGIVILMLTFGSMFGFTVLGRIALLIDRVADLQSYTAPAYSLASAAPGAATDWMGTLLSPPCLVGALMILLLALGAASRRTRTAPRA